MKRTTPNVQACESCGQVVPTVLVEAGGVLFRVCSQCAPRAVAA